MNTTKKIIRETSSIRSFIAEHPRLIMLGFSLALIIGSSIVTGFADHQAYAKIEDQQTLIIPVHH